MNTPNIAIHNQVCHRIVICRRTLTVVGHRTLTVVGHRTLTVVGHRTLYLSHYQDYMELTYPFSCWTAE